MLTLGASQPGGGVGDYVHATCGILCILVKRLRGEFHKRGIHVGVRELDGEMHEIKEVCKGIPEAESGMQRSRAWCGTPPILGVVNMVGTRNFTCYMGAL